ncbi:MAG: prepilin-type N-terminal cleavage/methylation domain-containing protein [Lentisphaeraceae bacterium]|nr:prepilin-type N-terminal cleavage/methylation domain-containing protein [Lentisphaeraceae bacterium]
MKKKFSLIELMVVISLIGILSSMLIPALEAARQKAKTAVCARNLKQFGILFNVYSNSNGSLPIAAGGDNSPVWNGWGDCIDTVMDKRLSDYDYRVGADFGIWQCPENLVQRKPMGLGAGESDQSYQPNGWNNSELFLETNYDMHEDPSSLHALFDGMYYRTEPWKNTGENTIYDYGISNARYAHSEGLNMLYSDGHAKWLPPILEYRGPWQGGSGASAFLNGSSWYCQ